MAGTESDDGFRLRLEIEDEKKIIEKLYYKGNSVTYFYNEPVVLKVIEGVKKKQCTSDCINLKSNSSYSVSIMNGGRKLQTNFNTDKIFIQYYYTILVY